jgi:SPX domain protein involved in polyphosphate accumulation
MRERLEKKFVYEDGSQNYRYFLLSGMFKKSYPKRVVNSIYLDTEIYQDVWDNINGFNKRKKIRLRWYDKLNNSPVYIEEKKKIGFITKKKQYKLGLFKNFDELDSFVKNQHFFKNNFLITKKINLKKSLFIQYEREYFEQQNKLLRITIDKNLKIFQNFPNRYILNDKIILELKYDIRNSAKVNNFIKINKLNNRNQKFSKYVNSFIEMHENAII